MQPQPYLHLVLVAERRKHERWSGHSIEQTLIIWRNRHGVWLATELHPGWPSWRAPWRRLCANDLLPPTWTWSGPDFADLQDTLTRLCEGGPW